MSALGLYGPGQKYSAVHMDWVKGSTPFIPGARCGLQRLIADFVDKDGFFVLVEGHIFHHVGPHIGG